MWFNKIMIKTLWADKKHYEDIMKESNSPTQLVTGMRRKQSTFFGHGKGRTEVHHDNKTVGGGKKIRGDPKYIVTTGQLGREEDPKETEKTSWHGGVYVSKMTGIKETEGCGET